MWVFFYFYATSSLSLYHTLMIILFAANVIVAHIAAFIIYYFRACAGEEANKGTKTLFA